MIVNKQKLKNKSDHNNLENKPFPRAKKKNDVVRFSINQIYKDNWVKKKLESN
jgi:hypothetical protein